MEHWSKDADRGKLRYWEKDLFPCHFAHHNSTWIGFGLNLSLHGQRLMT